MEAKNPAAAVKPGSAKPKVVVEAYTFRKNGLPYIRKAALTFGVSLLLSGALVTAGRLVLFQARPGTAAAQAQQMAARDRLIQAEIERVEIRDFQPKFEQLRTRGFVGPENRLAMVEAIQSIQQSRGLLPVTFSFSAQQIVAIDPALLGPPLELHSSSVHLRMALWHELDLVNFFRDLKGRGFFAVKECLLNALPEMAPGVLAPRLDADCTLYWLTVGEAVALDPNAPPVVPGG
jgi:hypothetical protein